jgi:Trk-type K+ transport system membrane component
VETLSEAGLLLMIVLMFIGASPGGTGGGIKTTTSPC